MHRLLTATPTPFVRDSSQRFLVFGMWDKICRAGRHVQTQSWIMITRDFPHIASNNGVYFILSITTNAYYLNENSLKTETFTKEGVVSHALPFLRKLPLIHLKIKTLIPSPHSAISMLCVTTPKTTDYGRPVRIALTALPKINSHSQIFRYGRSIFCLPHRPKFSDSFDLCLHWVSVVRDFGY